MNDRAYQEGVAEWAPQPRKVALILGAAVLCLVAAGVVAVILHYYAPPLFAKKTFIRLFTLDEEGNIPTWYSTAALLVSASLAAVRAAALRRNGAPHAVGWAILSGFLVFLSMDEAASIHDSRLGNFIYRTVLDIGDQPSFLWLIPGMILVALIAPWYRALAKSLQSDTRRLFLMAGLIFVSGGLGMEAVGWYFASNYGTTNVPYAMITVIEETLEMAGTAVLIYILVHELPGFSVRVRVPGSSPAQSADTVPSEPNVPARATGVIWLCPGARL